MPSKKKKLPSKKEKIKGCSECCKCCKCCPTGPAITPVYGSLYTKDSFLANANTNVNFNTIGFSSGVKLNITDDPTIGNSITVNSLGIYTVSFSTNVAMFGSDGDIRRIVFGLSINGIPDETKVIDLLTTLTTPERITFENNTLSRTDQLVLNQGDVIQIFIVSTSGSVNYHSAALVVTKVT